MITTQIVGSANGEFTLWDIGTHQKLVSKPFKVSDMQACSTQYQVTEHILKFSLLFGFSCRHVLILYICASLFFYYEKRVSWLKTLPLPLIELHGALMET